MKSIVPEGLRNIISKKYLDWAEALPKSNIGIIQELQFIRSADRRWSKRLYQQSRPPIGSHIRLLGIQMFEVFYTEDTKSLQMGLSSLFSKVSNKSELVNMTQVVGNLMENSLTLGGRNVGVIHRDKDDLYGSTLDIYLPELPEEVWFIQIWLEKISPSISILSFQVYFSDLINYKIIDTYNQQYLSDIRFTNLFPFSRYKMDHSTVPSHKIMRGQIQKNIDELRRDIEKVLLPHTSGYFAQRSPSKIAKFPAVEIYSIEGMPNEPDLLSAWMHKSRDWLEVFDVDMYGNIFDNGKLMIELPKYTHWSYDGMYNERFVSHIIIKKENFVDSENFLGYSNKDFGTVSMSFDYAEHLMPLIAMHQFTNLMNINIDKIRQTTLLKVHSRTKFREYVDFSSSLQKEYIFLDRTLSDFENQKEDFLHIKGYIPGMILLTPSGKYDGNILLVESLIDQIGRRFELLNSQLKQARNAFSDNFAIINLDLSYKLQLNATILAIASLLIGIASLIVSIVGLISSWSTIKQFFGL